MKKFINISASFATCSPTSLNVIAATQHAAAMSTDMCFVKNHANFGSEEDTCHSGLRRRRCR